MPSSIVVRRDGDSWVIELEIHNGKDKVVLGKDPSLRIALRQALYVAMDIASGFIGLGQYYCSGEWKDLLNGSSNVEITRILTTTRVDVNSFLNNACRNEPIYVVENVEYT